MGLITGTLLVVAAVVTSPLWIPFLATAVFAPHVSGGLGVGACGFRGACAPPPSPRCIRLGALRVTLPRQWVRWWTRRGGWCSWLGAAAMGRAERVRTWRTRAPLRTCSSPWVTALRVLPGSAGLPALARTHGRQAVNLMCWRSCPARPTNLDTPLSFSIATGHCTAHSQGHPCPFPTPLPRIALPPCIPLPASLPPSPPQSLLPTAFPSPHSPSHPPTLPPFHPSARPRSPRLPPAAAFLRAGRAGAADVTTVDPGAHRGPAAAADHQPHLGHTTAAGNHILMQHGKATERGPSG